MGFILEEATMEGGRGDFALFGFSVRLKAAGAFGPVYSAAELAGAEAASLTRIFALRKKHPLRPASSPGRSLVGKSLETGPSPAQVNVCR